MMSTTSLAFPTDSRSFLALLQLCAQKESIDAYLVGGYIRNLFLGRTSKDIDVLCLGKGSGLRLAEALKKSWGSEAKCAFFPRFGTAQVKYKDYVIECVGARKESYSSHSRHPSITEGTLAEDLARRDFSCNALAYSINSYPQGEIIDHFEGLKDIENKCLRTPLDPRSTFSDDPLRMMRAARFSAQLGFSIDAPTRRGMRSSAHRIDIISQERITEEMNLMIMSQKPSIGFRALLEGELLSFVFPELLALKGTEEIDNHTHKDNFYHTLQVLDNISQASDRLYLRWAALLHDIAKPLTKAYDPKVGWTFHGHEEKGARMVPSFFKRLRLPMSQVSYVKKLVRLHLRPLALVSEQATDSAIRRLLHEAGDDIDDLMSLCRADITSKNDHRVRTYLQNFKKVEEKMQDIEQKDSIRNFQPPISGEEIMKTFDIPPSPIVGRLKQGIKNAILDGQISNTPEDAHRFMCQIAEQEGLKPLPHA